MKPTDRRWNVAAFAVAVLGFVLLDMNRLRVPYGCDAAGYFVESLRFRGLISLLGIDPTIPIRGPLAPLCTEFVKNGNLVSFFPPGFSLILAITGTVGLEFHTTALFGSASALALFQLVKGTAGPAIALGTMVMWLASPLVLFGGTQMMSDLPAASLLLFSLLALRRERWVTAGLLFGFAIGVRPAEALFALPLVLFEPRVGRLLRVGVGVLLAATGWVLLLRLSLGTFTPPYARNADLLSIDTWLSQFSFFGRTTARLHRPMVFLTAVACVRRFRATLPYLVWFGSFLMFYSFWHPALSQWWEARFMLAGLPALFLAAAEGAHCVSLWRRLPPRIGAWGFALLIAGYCALDIESVVALRAAGNGDAFRMDAERVSERVPKGTLIGTANDSFPLRWYGHMQAFQWCDEEAPRLIRWASFVARPLYAVLGPDERACGSMDVDLVSLETLPTGRTLFKIVSPFTVNVGTPAARPLLLEGWSGDEGSDPDTWVWIVGKRAVFQLPSSLPLADTRMRMSLTPFDKIPQKLQVLAREEILGTFDLAPGRQVVEVTVPARLTNGRIDFVFSAATAPAANGTKGDHRLLAAAVRGVTFRSGVPGG